MSHNVIFPLINLCLDWLFLAASPAEAPIQENGEANGEVKEPVDPNAPKKCDVIVISGRKERCEAAVEALKVCIITELHFVSHNCCFVSLTCHLSSGFGSCHY